MNRKDERTNTHSTRSPTRDHEFLVVLSQRLLYDVDTISILRKYSDIDIDIFLSSVH